MGGKIMKTNGKTYFRECCAGRGIPEDMWFKIGAQNAKSNGGYVYHCPPELRKNGQLYAVNYVKERDLYIAWNLAIPEARTKKVFRLLFVALEDMKPGKLLTVEKMMKHHGWGQETVYVFDRDAVEAFLDVVTEEKEKIRA